MGQDDKTVYEMRIYRVIPLDNEYWQLVLVPDWGGRILQMIDKSTGRDLLRTAKPTEGNYPDIGGQIVQAYPDFPLCAWTATWSGVSRNRREAVMEGLCGNGLILERRVRLDGVWVRTEVFARNTSVVPLEVVLQARAEFEPGDIDAARVRFRTTGGVTVDRTVITPGEQPNGSETRKGQDVPDREWTLARAGMPSIINRFARDLVERTAMSWTAKGGPRVTLGVWSKKRLLAPGERLELKTDYR